MTKKYEIKNCPFCGSEAKLKEFAAHFYSTFWIECKNCHNSTQKYTTARTALKHWNRRFNDE